MNARTYCLARFPGQGAIRPVPMLAVAEAQESADFWAVVKAATLAHAMRLLLEGQEAVRGADGRLERCGIVEVHGDR